MRQVYPHANYTSATANGSRDAYLRGPGVRKDINDGVIAPRKASVPQGFRPGVRRDATKPRQESQKEHI